MTNVIEIPTGPTELEEAISIVSDWLETCTDQDIYGILLVSLTRDGQILADTNLDAFHAHTVCSFLEYLQLQAIEETQH